MKWPKPFDPGEFITLKEALAIVGDQGNRIAELEHAMCDCRHRLAALSMGTEGQTRKMVSEAAVILTLALAGCDTYDQETRAQHSPSDESEGVKS